MKNLYIFIVIIILISFFTSCGNKPLKNSEGELYSPPSLEVPHKLTEDEIKRFTIKASVLMEDKKYHDALEILKKLKSKNSLSKNRIDILTALCHLNVNESEKCIKILEKMNPHYLPEYRDFFMCQAKNVTDKKKSINDWQKFSSEYPESPLAGMACLYCGNIFYYEKKYEEAKKYYLEAICFTENLNFFPAVYYRLAKIYEEEKHWEEALSCYSKIEYLYPFHEFSPEAVKKTVYLELYRTESPYTPSPGEALCAAETYYVRHRFKLALKYYREYTELYPEEALSSGGYYDRASCELAAGSGEKAVNLLREIYEDGGEYAPAAFYKLAELSGSTKKMKEVAEKYPGTNKGSEAQYKAGLYLEYDGKQAGAMKEYRLMADLFPEGNWGDAAFWRLGRIYYREKLYSNAYDAFLRVSALYSRNDWASDCIFWQAKCAEKMGRQGEAESLYKKLAESYDHTYYSYRAREKLLSMGYEEYTLPGPEEKPSFREGLRTAFKGTFEDRHYENFTELAQLGLFEYAENELLLVKFPEEKEREKKYALALVKAGEKKYVDAIKLINETYEDMIFKGKSEEIPLTVTYVNYPMGYGENIMREADIRGIDPCLVSALIREESHYDPSVISWADAYGLMQIIPSTGEYIAKKLSRNFSVSDLIIPEKNIEMGTFYIAKIYKDMDNNEVLALAGYNGGPGNAEYWWDTKYKGDIDEFIEDIPYGETRNYVKKVLRTYWEYKRLYDREQPDYCGRW